MKTLPKAMLVCGAVIAAVTGNGATLQFDGTDDYVQAGAIDLANSSFTIEAWARRLSANTIDFILGQGSAATDQGLHFGFHYAGTVTNMFVFGFYYDDLFTTDRYTDDGWHHWAGTYNATNKERCLYRDGILVASNTASANYQGSGPLLIGQAAWGGAAFHGLIDEVRVWNVARTGAEIAGWWNRRLVGNEPNLLAYYPMEEGAGTMTADATGHGFTGTLANGVLWDVAEDAVGPLAVTGLAAALTPASEQLTGLVKPGVSNLFVWFQWGLTTNYGSATPINNVPGTFTKVPVSAVVTGLATNITYHYRAVGSNSFGVSYGANRSFAIVPVPVTTSADTGPGSLRQAISDGVSGATIFLTNTGTITLTSGELPINKDLTIVGPGAANLAISGNNNSRVFSVASNANVTISGLTIEDGRAPNGADGSTAGAAGASGESGGGVYNAGVVTLSDCVITDNAAGNGGNGSDGTGDGGAGGNGGSGGAGGGVYNAGTGELWLEGCAVSDNTSGDGGLGGAGARGSNSGDTGHPGGRGGSGGTGGSGAGVFSAGKLIMDRCASSANSNGAGGTGGRGGNGGDNNPVPVLGHLHWGGNGGTGGVGGPGGFGGGVYADGYVTLNDCTISGNENGHGGNGGNGGNGGDGSTTGWKGAGGNGGVGGGGGGIFNHDALELVSCTVACNVTSVGGAAGPAGTGHGADPASSNGEVGSGGGIANSDSALPVQTVNTIVALNTRPIDLADDVSGAFASRGHNLVSSSNGSTGFGVSGDLVNRPALLAPLADNGGPTWTHALWAESPAVNAGDNTFAAAFDTDQRGFPRIDCTNVDIGAFEYVGCPWLPHPAARNALYFDGVDDYVQGNSSVTLSNSSFTIEAWVRRDMFGTLDCILGQGTTSPDRGLHFGFRPGNTFTFAFYSDDLNTTNTYADTEWHHWAGTYDTNGHVRLIYRDGTLVASNTASANYVGAGPLRLGDAPWGGWPFDGAIDEVRVWNVVRTADEIAQSRGRTLTGTEPGLVAYFRFDEGSGTKTSDLKGTSPADLVNGPAWVSSGAPLYQPIVTTLAAESVRSTTATLRGTVNPAGPSEFTSAWFEYGTSLNLGSYSPSQYFDPGLVPLPMAFAVSNLESGTKYYFRLAANNNNTNTPGTIYGEILTFDTLAVGSGYPISTRANNGQSTTSPRHITDSVGNIYLAGLFSGSVTLKDTLQAAGSGTNAFLAQLARAGDWRWDVNIPVTNGQAQIKGLALDSRTNVLVAGTFSGTVTFGNTNFTAPTNCARAFIARFEPATATWTWATALGAGTNNSANALAVGSEDRLYVAGQLSGTNTFGTTTLVIPVGSDIFVACFNAAGQPEWATQAGGTGATDQDAATAVAVGPFGEIYVTGFFANQGAFGPYSLTSAGNSDVFFAALNTTNGQVQRVVRAGGAGNDRGTALATDPSGNIYLVAQLAGAANFDGSPLPELDSSGMNLVVARLNRQGVLSRRAAARAAYADSIAVSPSGRVYLAGDFTGVMRYGPTLITVGTGTNASSDVFLAQLAEGLGDALDWADLKQIGGIGTETRGTVSVDPSGSVVVSGTYAQSLHVGYVEITTPNAQEIFLARLDADGTYEHNRWEIGQALIPPDEALASVEENRAKGLLSIEILAAPPGLADSDAENSFFWNDEQKQLYAIRPVTARIKWRLDANITNLANVATMVGRCVWPDHPQTNVAGAPVELEGPGVGRGYFYGGISFNTNGATVLPATRGMDQFQVFQTATNASGYNVIHYTTRLGAGVSFFDVVYTRPYADWSAPETLDVDAGKALIRGAHQDSTGKNGYVLFERSSYDGAAYDRSTRTGPIIPVNRNLRNDPNRALVVVWYRTNEVTGVAWGSDPVRYTVSWPGDAPKLVIAAGAGAPADEALYPQAQVYHQPNTNLAGFNPNEEHALIVGGRLYALRCDLNDFISPKASEPYVLLKYLGPDATNDWRMQIFHVIAEDAGHTFANFTNCLAGGEVQLPAPLNLLPLCASSNRIAFGQAQAHQAWNGKIYAKSAGYVQLQYWYSSQEQFYFGATNPPVGTCVPWMSQYVQAGVTPGAARVLGEPVLVGYQVSWPTDVPSLQFGETLTTPAHDLPDLLHFASARVIYDDGNPQGASWADSLVRIFDPLSERTIQLSSTFKLPTAIAAASDRGRKVFTDLPYPLRIRLFYDDLNQRLSFGGWYDPAFGAGEPLLLPNILSPRERDRIKQLDGTNTVSAFDQEIDRLYDLTRNPNQVDADRDGKPDKELRVGLITQIRDGFNEILIGPVTPGPDTNFITWRTNVLSQPVSSRVTNVVQEQFGDLPKALTAGLRPGSGYVTIVENDDPLLPGQPIGLHILYVTNSLFRGDLKVLPSDNVFDERLTLRHSSDFGGEPQNYEFEWYYQPDQNGVSPPFPVLAAGQTNWNGWIRFPTPPTGTTNGANDITLGEGNSLSSLLVLCDNWLLCRYRAFRNGVSTDWSDWVGAPGGDAAMLAEGWVKRVIAGLNEFDSRTKDFHEAPAATYASMILQAGERYEGPIAFNPDPNYLNSLGLIESYATVLDRARKLSVDGIPPVNFGPANSALLRAAGKIADLYMLLGNEAYADASDPTIGFTTSSGEYGNLAPSIFCFQNQLDSPLEEELALLRGRDDSAMTVKAPPYYNRLIWNFTQGEGEVAYKLTYNISDQNGDGFIDEKDARILYPQGHGDAWGHYLTAITAYYELLRHPNYEWVPRPEAVTVGGSPVQVDYLDERKFAQAAAAKAKTGAEIVNLTYRQKYVEDPSGQWQGYKDTQPDRAWGVDGWARRAGTGAYFDWVVANAILPATDPDTNHVGIQKVDRTTVTELADIPSQFATIEAQLDTVDRGLNPLGLAVGAMPFDIDPSKVASGETHFDQIYNRALKAMDNALALFDYANALSQSLRRNQDSVEQFTSNVDDKERDYKNRLIEIFGYPYAGDIGPSGAYPSGYDGPDIVHYMYVSASDLTGDKTQPSTVLKSYFKPVSLGVITKFVKYLDSPDELPSANDVFTVDYPLVEQGSYRFQAPAAWGSRRAPGKVQDALGEMLKARAQLNQAIADYDNLRKKIQDELNLLELNLDMKAAEIALQVEEKVTVQGINTVMTALGAAADAVKLTASTVEKQTDAVVESLPKSVGLATDATAPARGALKIARNIATKGLELAATSSEQKASAMEQAKQLVEMSTRMALSVATSDYEKAEKVKAIEELFREEVPKRIELYTLRDDLQRAYEAYLAVVAEGERLLEERYEFRVKTAAEVQEYRYQDMAFRIFQNDALQKYRAQFDLAARYVYLAAKAYDYETCLLNTESGAGSKLLTDIVRQRTLGQLVNGLPVSGRNGLADPLARLGQNFEVYRGQLGFTTPETETGRFSLRSELFRVRPGDLQTNALNGIVSTNQDWRAMLQACRVPDLWQIPEFRRFCRPFAPESAGPQPGLVIRIPTTITFGLNYFGWPLGPGDSAYDSSRFATKVRSAGVWFSDYNLAGLSMTPRVYLVPTGTDIMRSPSSYELETREFNVVDQKLPVPFPIGASDLNSPSWIPINDSLSETFGDIRRFSSFRAYHDKGYFDETEATQDTRLIGRSVWNTRWMLIIPGGTFLYDPNRGLDTFIATVGDIKVFFQTYSYSGN